MSLFRRVRSPIPTTNMKELEIIDIQLLNEVSGKAKASPRLRMKGVSNYFFLTNSHL